MKSATSCYHNEVTRRHDVNGNENEPKVEAKYLKCFTI